jgi:uncharacterized protein (DUF983 family)
LALIEDLVFCLKPRCPVCRKGKLFRSWSMTVTDKCAECGAELGAHDVGDGASVFLIFILGFTLVPAALAVDHFLKPPGWVHGLLWPVVALALVAVLMPAVKAYIILLEFRHRRGSSG